jgi:signal peptidase I
MEDIYGIRRKADIRSRSGLGQRACDSLRNLTREGYQGDLWWAHRCVACVLILLCACIGIRESVIETFYISSGSMTPTLHVDDRIVVLKSAYGLRAPFSHGTLLQWNSPKRGEIVVFRQSDGTTRSMVKRVVGIGGDVVSVSRDGVRVNGEILVEPYVRSSAGADSPEGVFMVPPDSLFLLGDNRDESFDSRYWQNPFVRTQQLIGPVALVY